MNDINVRNVIFIVAAVVIGLVVLGFIGTILNNIIPMAIVAVIAFILGRTSNRVNYLEMGRNAARRVGSAAQATTAKAAERAETRQQAQGYGETAQVANQKIAVDAQQAAEQAAARAEAQGEPPARLVEAAPAEEDQTTRPDFTVKTSEQLQAESRRLEEEAARKAAAMDVQAALEERKRRLLGDQGESS